MANNAEKNLADNKEAIAQKPVSEQIAKYQGAVAGGYEYSVGLKTNGTVVTVGDESKKDWKLGVRSWHDIVAVAASFRHIVGLKADGTVVVTGYKDKYDDYGQLNVSGWRDIVAVAVGAAHTVGVKADGTVVAGMNNFNDGYGVCNVSDWRDIVAVAAGFNNTVGVKADGTVVAVGDNESGQCNVSGWRDIIAVAVGKQHIIGLKADSTVVAVGSNEKYSTYETQPNGYQPCGQCDVSGWSDIVAVAAGGYFSVGLKKDGKVVITGKYEGPYDIDPSVMWTNDFLPYMWNNLDNIVGIVAGEHHVICLKADGTVVAFGSNKNGKCNVGDWRDIGPKQA